MAKGVVSGGGIGGFVGNIITTAGFAHLELCPKADGQLSWCSATADLLSASRLTLLGLVARGGP